MHINEDCRFEWVMNKPLTLAAVAIIAVVLGASLIVFLNSSSRESQAPPVPTAANYTYSIVKTYPHDTSAFTEGLWYAGDGYLYESSGSGNGASPISTLRKVDLATGKVVQEYTLPAQYFAEGIAVVGNELIQLTYTSNIGFVYDKNTFAILGNFSYPTEGWGLTYDGKQLIMSDGSDHLYFLNATTFQRTGDVQVLDGNNSVTMINSLDYINGYVYANIWLTNKIAVINPQTGQVTSWIDLTGLPASAASEANINAVLNGIAYDQQGNRLFVTGKDWTSLYQIELVPESKT